eukprot:1081838-Pelagomonas_calceolata.AAC.1
MQGAGPHPVMSRVPSSQGLHAASSPPSHFSSAGESQMLRSGAACFWLHHDEVALGGPQNAPQ